MDWLVGIATAIGGWILLLVVTELAGEAPRARRSLVGLCAGRGTMNGLADQSPGNESPAAQAQGRYTAGVTC